MKKKAYFIGIAGKTMGQLAKAFKDLGWEVSGSDQQKVYPPLTDFLSQNKIIFFRGYNAQNVPQDADLIVVGRSALLIDPKNPEYEQAKKTKSLVVSYPEVLQKYLIRKNSIVICGTYAKTTISALVTWILQKQGLNPSFMVGGVLNNGSDGLKITDSDYSVVEGDEPPALLESDPSKFMYYQAKYLILTASIFDHPEIFKSEEEYQNNFKKLVEKLPQDGLLVYNPKTVAPKIITNTKAKLIKYCLDDKTADYFISDYHLAELTNFTLDGKVNLKLQTTLLGIHNLENICGAVALCLELGLDPQKISQAVTSFRGVKTRLEYLGNFNGRILYWDFAQHPTKVMASISAVRAHYPDSKITIIFDPSSTALKFNQMINGFDQVFNQVDQVIVGRVSFLKEIEIDQRITGNLWVGEIKKSNSNVVYQPDDEQLIDALVKKSDKNQVMVFMSSGGIRFTNIIEQVKIRLAKLDEN